MGPFVERRLCRFGRIPSPLHGLRRFQALYSREHSRFQNVELLGEGGLAGVPEAGVRVDLPEPLHSRLVQPMRRPPSALLRGLLRLPNDTHPFQGVRDRLVAAVETGVRDVDRAAARRTLTAATGEELAGVEEDQARPDDRDAPATSMPAGLRVAIGTNDGLSDGVVPSGVSPADSQRLR